MPRNANPQNKKSPQVPPLPPPPFYKTHHRERAVTGKIFQALLRQTDR